MAFTDNHPDHRVRLHVPLHRPATHSHAEGQFAVVARGLHSEGRHGEVPLPTFLTVTGDGVTMTSLRRRDEEWLELRVVATTDQPTTAHISHLTAARRTDLLGNPGPQLSVVDGQVELPLRPWEIASIQLSR